MSRTAPTIRQRFGRYETLFRFASGGMAEVFAARTIGAGGFERLVAIKRVLSSMNDDERIAEMFMDEGRLAANITSPHVVSTLDLGQADDESLYIVMDLVIGAPLSRILSNAVNAERDDPSPTVATEIIRQAARGLHDAHEARTPTGEPLEIVHRDISPQNILVGVDGTVRITDFGVAHATQRKTRTSTGEFKGKLSYFSPEQTANRPLDRRCDVFALGIVAWETLCGRRLFHAENPLAVLDRVMSMPVPPPHEVRPRVPRAVSDVVMKALERDPDARYQTAAELEVALRDAALESLPICSRDELTELVERYGGKALATLQSGIKEALAERPAGEPASAAPARRAPSWIKTGVVAATAVGGTLLAVWLGSGATAGSVQPPDARAPAPQEATARAPVPERGADPGAGGPTDEPPASTGAPVPSEPSASSDDAAREASETASAQRRALRRRRRAAHRAAAHERAGREELAATPDPPAPPDPAEPAEPSVEEPPEPEGPRLGTNRAPILR